MSDLWLGIIIGAIAFYIGRRIDLFIEDWYNDYRTEKLRKREVKGAYA